MWQKNTQDMLNDIEHAMYVIEDGIEDKYHFVSEFSKY